jgi:hypothetical protein
MCIIIRHLNYQKPIKMELFKKKKSKNIWKIKILIPLKTDWFDYNYGVIKKID